MGRPQEIDSYPGFVGLRLPLMLREDVEKMAKEKNLTVSDFIRGVLAQKVRENETKNKDDIIN